MVAARPDLAGASSPPLEPTYSPDEVAKHLGVEVRTVRKLVALGQRHGSRLHPTRGGLWPTFRPSYKVRRITLSAIERHKAHMERVLSV